VIVETAVAVGFIAAFMFGLILGALIGRRR
jgi:ABC-type nitrate/sulfonate/bicarbonate transport system permease component